MEQNNLSLYIERVTDTLLIQSYLTIFLMSFALCCVIIISSRYGFARRSLLDEMAIQSAHKGFVPRVGGIGIYLSFLGFIPLSAYGFIPLSVVFDLKINEMTWIALSASPVFFIGLAEDIGYSIPPKWRFCASVFSGFLVICIFGVWLTNLGTSSLNFFLSFPPLAILFTLFAAAGVVNAFNLIDGLNGLSSYVSLSSAIALSVIAFQVGNFQLTLFLILLSAAILGFVVLNFPLGKIFLGDSGAYVLGHLLVWCAILLTHSEPMISPFAILLVFFWPVADTLLAIWRRLKLGNRPDLPDRLHFHQLTMRFLEIRFFGREKRQITNPLATIILVPLISFPQIIGICFWSDVGVTVWSSILMTLIFVLTYLFGISLAKKSRYISGKNQ